MAIGKRIYGKLIISMTGNWSFTGPRDRERMDSRKFILERTVLKRPEREKVWFGQEYRGVNSIDKHTRFRVHKN